MSTPRRSRNSDAGKGPIRLRVVSPEITAIYSMPWTDKPVDVFAGLPAHMLDGAVLYVEGATSLRPVMRSVVATVPHDEVLTRRK